jgi:NTE family protein
VLDYMYMESPKYPKIGLALGSGGPRGLAHIGVIKVLVENNIPINYIAGASIGAMIGGFYAVNNDIDWVEKVIVANDWRKILALYTPTFGKGLVGGSNILKYIESHIGRVEFKQLKTKLAILATDIRRGESICIDKGLLSTAIRGSTSVPVLFEPAEREGKLLADAGLSVPVPVETARAMGAEFVIAVNLDGDYFKGNLKVKGSLSLYDIADHSIMTLRKYLARANVQTADFVIEPPVGKVEWSEFADAKKGIKEGEKYMRTKLPQLLLALENYRTLHNKNTKA